MGIQEHKWENTCPEKDDFDEERLNIYFQSLRDGGCRKLARNKKGAATLGVIHRREILYEK